MMICHQPLNSTEEKSRTALNKFSLESLCTVYISNSDLSALLMFRYGAIKHSDTTSDYPENFSGNIVCPILIYFNFKHDFHAGFQGSAGQQQAPRNDPSLAAVETAESIYNSGNHGIDSGDCGLGTSSNEFIAC
jgi:hypothetical protein